MKLRLGRDTKVIVQGITGREGSFHTKLMLEYGTKIVAGVTPGKGGLLVHGVKVYNTIREAVEEVGSVDASIVFVPARNALDAVLEAIDNGIQLVVVITEGIPVHDELKMVRYSKIRGVNIIGPNTPGLIVPGETKIGIMPAHYYKPGIVGILSRSGTLSYEVAWQLSRAGLGVSVAIGIGGDPVTGLDFIEAYNMLLEDHRTRAVVLIGEIGGDYEERFAKYYASLSEKKPVVAYIAGMSAPREKRMGHAGAIISMGLGDYDTKVRVLEENNIRVARKVSDIPRLVSSILS
ncbi:succinate--CoA ligase subunit alpha [Thermogladius sp. 4427co]|uniref:succinate--CoA ligase subunit alpha n=1 Tax=Thermogladius sp. 4427co TaxID=3450718 RepID=UPI003F7A8044